MSETLAQMIGAAFGAPQAACPPAAPARRRKLWELSDRWHCPLIGTCLPVAELRRLAAKSGIDAGRMSDYTLHTVAVGRCGERSRLAEGIQQFLERRYAAAVTRFAKARDEEAVLRLWRQALAAGNDVAGALWAAWSHAATGEDAGRDIYGDIHMLSHQVGAAVRGNLHRLADLERQNGRQRDELDALRLGLTEAQRGRDRDRAEAGRRLADAEQKAALLPRREHELAAARRALRSHEAPAERAEALARRNQALEEANAAHARQIAELTAELAAARETQAAAEAALEVALGVCDGVAGPGGCGRSCPAETALAGRCVLCIGGRSALVDGYRRLVENQGGRFLHHDGGQEESLHRIDAAVSTADAVVCQSGCISHAAYWRLKEACKKLGKPCVFVQSPGVGSFARGLDALAGNAPADGRIGRLNN